MTPTVAASTTAKAQAGSRTQPDLYPGVPGAFYAATETLFLENAVDRAAPRFWQQFIGKTVAEIERRTFSRSLGHGVFSESIQGLPRHRLLRLIKKNGFLYGELALTDLRP